MKELDNILKLILNDLNRSEKEETLRLIEADTEKQKLYKQAKYGWALISTSKTMSKIQQEESYSKLRNKLPIPKRSINIYSVLKYAAILLIFIASSFFMHYMGKNSQTQNQTLQHTQIVAEYGQISKVILPDSTVVWLNSGSTLRYNHKFSIDNRNLELEGQAYLQVKKNKEIPVIVACNKLNIKVLGTKFDVSAYPDDKKISVVLEQGSVQLLHTQNKQFSYRMKPGEKAVYDLASQNVNITETKPSEYAEWKEGILIFNDTQMTEVLKTLERKYDIEIQVQNPAVYKSVFNARFKNESLEKIVELMEFSCRIDAEIIQENGINTKLILK